MQITYRTNFAPFPEDEQPRTRIVPDRGAAVPHGDPYRGIDGSLQTFGQHISIAFDLANELAGYAERFPRAIRAGAAEVAEALSIEFGSRWETMWSQLQDARRIAAAAGRDVSRYDDARDAAKDLSRGAAFVDIGAWQDVGFNERKRDVTYRMPALDPAIEALAALHAAVPEVAIESQPAVPDLRARRRTAWKWIALAVVLALAIAIGVYEWNLVHSDSFRR